MCDDLKAFNTTKLSVLPTEVRDHVKMLLSLKPELRPDSGQFAKVNKIKYRCREIWINLFLDTIF